MVDSWEFPSMFEIRETDDYRQWLIGLRDLKARTRIAARVERLILGNPGDVKPVGEGVSELRIDWGPGYRVYYCRKGQRLILLICGGDKRTQQRDIDKALLLARLWKED
jgi:putative addiction module killer protein